MTRIASAFLLIPVAAALPASAERFYLEITLRNGKQVSGTVPQERATFEAVTVDGKTVRTRLQKLPSYAKRRWSQEITWNASRRVFVVRAPSWTGELSRIWKELALDLPEDAQPAQDADALELDLTPEGGQRIVVKGKDVERVRVRFGAGPAPRKRPKGRETR